MAGWNFSIENETAFIKRPNLFDPIYKTKSTIFLIKLSFCSTQNNPSDEENKKKTKVYMN